MPTQEVLASPVTRRDRADQEFRGLFTAFFPPLAHAVHRHRRRPGGRRGDHPATRSSGCSRTGGRSAGPNGPDEWVRRVALARGGAGRGGTERRGPDDGLERRRAAVVRGRSAPSGRTPRCWRPRAGARVRRRSALGGAVGGGRAGGRGRAGASGRDSRGRRAAPALALGPPPWATERGRQPAAAGRARRAVADRPADPGRRRAPAARGRPRASTPTTPRPSRDGRFRIRLSVHAERSVLTVAGDQRSIGILRRGGAPGRPSSRCRPTWASRTSAGRGRDAAAEPGLHRVRAWPSTAATRPRCTRSRCTPRPRSRALT